MRLLIDFIHLYCNHGRIGWRTCKTAYGGASVAIVVPLKGVLFDPGVIIAFLEAQEEFRKIAVELADHDEHHEVVDLNGTH